LNGVGNLELCRNSRRGERNLYPNGAGNLVGPGGNLERSKKSCGGRGEILNGAGNLGGWGWGEIYNGAGHLVGVRGKS
jgi:hypothetical protein